MKRLLTASVIAGLIAAGCTSGDTTADQSDTTTGAETTAAEVTTTVADTTAPVATDSATSEPASTEAAGPPPGLTGPAPGVTDDAIKIGITYIDLKTTAVSTNHGDYEGSFRAVIDDINAKGGINGRKIEPVFAPISLSDGGNADAVCVQMTEDEKVFVVLGFFLGDAPACYLETHQTAILGGTMTEDLLARAKAPWYAWDPSSDFAVDSLKKLAEGGDLKGTVGVMASSTDQAFIDDTVLPTLKDAGIEVAEVGINDAPTDDQVLTDAQNAAILQKFEASGVDVILAPNNAVVLALGALETSAYRPRVVGTNYGTAQAFATDPARDLSVLKGFVTTGTFGPAEAQEAEPDMAACVELVKKAGVAYTTVAEQLADTNLPKSIVSAMTACRSLKIFQAFATKAGKDLNYGTFQWAGDNYGELKLVGSPEPYFYGAPPHADGDVPAFIYRWDDATKTMVIDN